MKHTHIVQFSGGAGSWAAAKRLAFERSAQLEEDFRQRFDKDVAILRDRRGGTTKPLTLRALAEREDFDVGDWGSCSCMVPPS